MIRRLLSQHQITAMAFNRTQAYKFSSDLPPCSYVPKPYTGKPKSEIAGFRDAYLNPGIFKLYGEYEYIVDAHMQYMYNEKGERYLDLFGGICTIGAGHGHPYIVDKLKQQIDKIIHSSTLYLTEPSALLAEKIESKLPKGLDNIYFVNSGSEANELAVMMAKMYTRNIKVLALNNAYHGAGAITSNLTSLRTWRYNTAPYLSVRHVQQPSAYRHQYSNDASLKELTNYAIADIQNVIDFEGSGDIAAFYSEPAFQGVGGIVHTVGDGTYHKRAYELVRSAGGLCVADEVQSGWGRLGDRYWGFEGQDIEPDFITVAKSLGNGIPIAAVITRHEIASTMKHKLHFNTYGGNPLSCAGALANLEAIDNDNLQENCAVVGGYFKSELKKLQEKHEIIGDVRGDGLALGMELVRNRDTKEPAPTESVQFLEELRKDRVLVGKGGLYGNVIRIQPPMCLTKPDVEYTIRAFDRALEKIKV